MFDPMVLVTLMSAGVAVLLLVLLQLALLQLRRKREQFDDLIAKYHNLRDAYHVLRDGVRPLALAEPNAIEQAELLREIAQTLREDESNRYIGVAIELQRAADELAPKNDADDKPNGSAGAEGVAHAAR